MFLTLGLANEIVDAIVDEQGYNNPQALRCLDRNGVENIMSAIHKPRGLNSGTLNPSVNVTVCSQEIITDECFALKHQLCYGVKFNSSIIYLEGL